MLAIKPPSTQPSIESSHPLALATLTLKKTPTSKPILVEWTSVREVWWRRNGRKYIRHVLEPILKEHLGATAWMKSFSKGLGLGLESYDVGRRLVIDVPIEPLPGEQYDLHIEGRREPSLFAGNVGR